MTDGPSDLPQLPLKLSLLALIGLRKPEQGDWETLRAFQYGNIHSFSPLRVVAHAIGVIIAVSIFFGKVPPTYLAAWPVAVIRAEPVDLKAPAAC